MALQILASVAMVDMDGSSCWRPGAGGAMFWSIKEYIFANGQKIEPFTNGLTISEFISPLITRFAVTAQEPRS